MLRKLVCLIYLVTLGMTANAGVITSATSAIINSGGPGAGNIADTYNQNGLLSHYLSGVTDFGTFLCTNPQHEYSFAGNEWFSNLPSATASVTYDLGAIKFVSALALWNEEASGIGLLNLLGSTDGINFTLLAGRLQPTDWPVANYGADVFSFLSTQTRYIRLDMSSCPQPNTSVTFNTCSIGEVAFDVETGAQAVPEPASLTLIGIGLRAGCIAAKRRKNGMKTTTAVFVQ